MSQENKSAELTYQQSHSTSELKVISKKREALEQVVKISLSINRLQQAFSAILNMGKSSSHIPPAALKLYSKLSNEVKSYPTQKLQQSLERVEKKVKVDLEKVLQFTQTEDSEGHEVFNSDLDEDTLFEIVNEFKRKAQTAVALGLMLQKRGIKPKEAVIPVPREVLAAKISHLEKKEEIYRGKIKTEITEMKAYIHNLISDESYPEAIKNQFRTIQESIERNLVHLESGRPLEELPIAMEMVEMGSEEDHNIPFQPTSLPEEAPVEHKTDVDKKVVLIKRSLFSRLWQWCFSPFGTRWGDIPRYKEK